MCTMRYVCVLTRNHNYVKADEMRRKRRKKEQCKDGKIPKRKSRPYQNKLPSRSDNGLPEDFDISQGGHCSISNKEKLEL